MSVPWKHKYYGGLLYFVWKYIHAKNTFGKKLQGSNFINYYNSNFGNVDLVVPP